jgi:AcrR family transcriptional regulator
MAGTSPATFYQYFPEIETAILEIANETARDGSRLLAPLEAQSWAGKSGYTTAEALVDAFLDFWREHDAILRVVDLASAEGDKRFHKIRGKVLTAVSKALAESIANLQGKGRSADGGDPAAMASTLVTMLAAVSAQQRTLESGVRLKDLRHTMTSLVYWGVTGRKPPR